MPNIIPAIGAKGFFQLSAPFDTLLVQGEQYTCKAIRNLSDYLSNNEDPKTDIYDNYGISAEYDNDVNNDIEIVSLQSELGHWLYVPVTHILAYPDTNGTVYRSVMIGLSLPALPIDTDITWLKDNLVNLVIDSIGVIPESKIVETSKPVLIEDAVHQQLTIDRAAAAVNTMTDRQKYLKLLQDHQAALNKLIELENYIKAHYVP